MRMGKKDYNDWIRDFLEELGALEPRRELVAACSLNGRVTWMRPEVRK
jgi:hypothetical protein